MKVYKIVLSSPREQKIDSVLNCKSMGGEQFKNVFLPAVCEGNIFVNLQLVQPARLFLLPFGRILIVCDGTVTGLKEKF